MIIMTQLKDASWCMLAFTVNELAVHCHQICHVTLSCPACIIFALRVREFPDGVLKYMYYK